MSAHPHHIIDAKSGLSKGRLPDAFLPSLYRVTAPYRGCSHGCVYCDGRAEKYFVEGDFEKDIRVRANLPELVAADVASGVCQKEYGAACIGSGVTDVYQPLERELGLTRRTLEALAPAQIPIAILTKNDLILRDFDVLAQFPNVLVVVTVTTLDSGEAALLEPGASSPEARLEVVRNAKQAGFFSGVMAMPLCPGISSSTSAFERLCAVARESGADFVYPGGLTLRPGRQKDVFFTLLHERFTQLLPLYEELYFENRPSGMPSLKKCRAGDYDWTGVLHRASMPSMIPHHIFHKMLSLPDSLLVLLCHMESLYKARGVQVGPLRAARERYTEWLQANRTALRRKKLPASAANPFPVTQLLTSRLTSLCGLDGNQGNTSPASGQPRDLFAFPSTPAAGSSVLQSQNILQLLQNEKLARLVTAIAKDGATFDYAALALTR